MIIQVFLALLASRAMAQEVSCPTITTHSICSTCPVNACLRLSTLAIPCGCSTAVPTSTISHACSDTCWAPECAGTSYAFTTEACQPTSVPPTAPSCPTVTTSIRPSGCVPPPPPGASFCAEPACLELKTMTWPCSCVGQTVPTATATDCACRTGCGTTTQVLYLPCPTSVPSPTPTDGPGCPA
ncbi:hypothetical protein CONLIGDRAFT_469177 [Coniochaeta ligniaria NRRL 30616]|uniref:Uncharacterized protein n=1 Tax=Coniochaeta ligniaria NRRL 30616 TaxID=1408157 RepID=A0A1J7JAR9_9PEZI|nr:hypothetical protein CONLIGDRAFT_469177 [Coniochaeta ligniaria NRRL 30616]